MTREEDAGSLSSDGDSSRLRYTVIGPGNAGKTSLIDSLDQACADPLAHEGPIQIEYQGGRQSREQADRSARTVGDVSFSPPPTDRTLWYESFVTASISRGLWRSQARKRLHLLFKDGPGGALFPAELDRGQPALLDWEREMLEESRHADAIVLCIDSTDPQLDLTSQHLRNVLSALARPRMRAKRFLLLLTKIDRLVSLPLDPGSPVGEGGRSPAPLQIAAALSPVELACELFHASNLMRILNALKPGAELAIGLASAWGFDASGFPFMDGNNPVRLSTQGRDRRTADWHPFGVREALHFLIDGQVGGPVELLTRKKVAGSRSHVLDLPPEYFDGPYLA